MMDMPSLILPLILASIVYALFLTFWVAVVVCLATANYPGSNPLVPQSSSNVMELSEIEHTPLRYRSNNDTDYKSFKRIEYVDVDLLHNMLWVYAFGLIWTVEFIFGKFVHISFAQILDLSPSEHHSSVQPGRTLGSRVRIV